MAPIEPTLLAAAVERTENDAVIELARSAAAVARETPAIGGLLDVVLPPGHTHELVDLERFHPAPRRKTEHVILHEAGSFAAYVMRHRIEAQTTMYAVLDHNAIVAVLDDSAADLPGWGEHQATLKLKLTKPWQHWTSLDGRQLTQEQFAEHMEGGLDEIAAPPALDMFELAQTFHATVGATFQQTGRLANGQRTLHYDENIQARAGTKGDIEIPQEFHLVIEPFEGSPAYDIVARLRFRIREARLTLSYHLVRPDEVLKQAFDATLEAIERGTGITAFRGTPPVRS
jgi:uncharacterized protein YfdQ (DUF2303 family)